MKKVKKVRFNELDQGQFFRFRKQIYLVDSCPCGIQLTGRNAGNFGKVGNHNLVTPIKVKIVEVK